MNEPKLNDIGLKHGTDKASSFHDYLRIYHHYFLPYRYAPIHLLEIGVAGGASIRTWLDYFPEARVTGMDHNTQFVQDLTGKLAEEGHAERCRILNLEANNPETWKRIDDVDILIDDASHYSTPTLNTFEYAWPVLRQGGFYIIEDLHQMLKVEPLCMFWITMDQTARTRLHEMGENYCAKRFGGDIEFMHWYKSLLVMKKR